jgi:hypothetical protein
LSSQSAGHAGPPLVVPELEPVGSPLAVDVLEPVSASVVALSLPLSVALPVGAPVELASAVALVVTPVAVTDVSVPGVDVLEVSAGRLLSAQPVRSMPRPNAVVREIRGRSAMTGAR